MSKANVGCSAFKRVAGTICMHTSTTESKHNQSMSKLITVQAAVVTSWLLRVNGPNNRLRVLVIRTLSLTTVSKERNTRRSTQHIESSHGESYPLVELRVGVPQVNDWSMLYRSLSNAARYRQHQRKQEYLCNRKLWILNFEATRIAMNYT